MFELFLFPREGLSYFCSCTVRLRAGPKTIGTKSFLCGQTQGLYSGYYSSYSSKFRRVEISMKKALLVQFYDDFATIAWH